jgi:hypothetical protein
LAGIAGRIQWRKTLYLVGIVLGLCLLAQQAWRGYQAIQQEQVCFTHPSFLLVALGLYIATYFVQMAAWALIMRFMQAPLSPQAVVEGYALSFLPRYIPGSVWGYLSRSEWLAQTHQVSYGASLTASLMETALFLITATLLGALYWLPTQLPDFPGRFPLIEFLIAVAGIVGAWLVWRVLPWLAMRFYRKRAGLYLPAPKGLGRQLGLWGVTTLLYLFFWLLQGGALVAVAHTLCGGLAPELFTISAAYAIAWVIGFLIIFVPAGLGVREWMLSTLLVAFAALQPGQATLLAILSRFGLIMAEIIVLAIGLHGQILSRVNQNRWNANDSSTE